MRVRQSPADWSTADQVQAAKRCCVRRNNLRYRVDPAVGIRLPSEIHNAFGQRRFLQQRKSAIKPTDAAMAKTSRPVMGSGGMAHVEGKTEKH